MDLSVTLIIIILTAIVSLSGFNNQKVIDDLIFYPPAVKHHNQWYRFITCGFIHADFTHLIFNMLGLYFFGAYVENAFIDLYGRSLGIGIYLILYFTSLFISLLPTYSKHQDDYSYRSLGASGAVSAVVFAGLAFFPTAEVYIFFIPIPIPGFIFAPLYLLISLWMAKKGGGNINHSAHSWGAIYGVMFVIVAALAIGFPIFENFINEVSLYMQVKGWTS